LDVTDTGRIGAAQYASMPSKIVQPMIVRSMPFLSRRSEIVKALSAPDRHGADTLRNKL